MKRGNEMAKSQLIKDLATNKISTEEGLQRLLVISSELNNEELTSWIMGELTGYPKNVELPAYRKNIGSTLSYSGINGSFQVTDLPLPYNFLPKEARELIEENPFNTSIRGIEKLLEENGKIGTDMTFLAGMVKKETGIICYSIYSEYSRVSIEEIISNVKNKLLLLLLDLEKEFGNLDNLDIEVDNLTTEKTQKIEESVSKIFYDDMEENI